MSGTVNRRLAGIASVTIDSVAFDLVGDLTYSPTVINRTALVGQSGYHGFSEMPQVCHISMTLRDNSGIQVADFQNMTNSTIQAFLASGKGVIGTSMFCTGAQEVRTQEGTFEVRFEGLSVYEQPGA